MEGGTIEVVARYPRVVVTYALMKVKIEVDGKVSARSWGSHSFDVVPGRHYVAVSCAGLMTRRAVLVEVGVGETTRVTYRAPVLRGLKGKIAGDNATPVAPFRGSAREFVERLSDEELLACWRDASEAERSTRRAVVAPLWRVPGKLRRAAEQELGGRGITLPGQD